MFNQDFATWLFEMILIRLFAAANGIEDQD
jgi:hypothetical protein